MSKKIGPNEPCPCGSKRKYKKCYNNPKLECLDKLKELFTKTIGYERAAIDELEKVAKDSFDQPSRMVMICAFTVLDVFANNEFAYLDVSGTPTQRFKQYSENYLLVEDNKTYKTAFLDRERKLDSQSLYTLRNNLTHYLGIGEGHKLVLANDKFKEDPPTLSKGEEFESLGCTILYPSDLVSMIKDAHRLFYEKISKDVEIDKTLFQEGVVRIYNRVIKEGAIMTGVNEDNEIYPII